MRSPKLETRWQRRLELLLTLRRAREAAHHIYLSRGFRLVEEEPHHSFGVDLIGQVYELDLHSSRKEARTSAEVDIRSTS